MCNAMMLGTLLALAFAGIVIAGEWAKQDRMSIAYLLVRYEMLKQLEVKAGAYSRSSSWRVWASWSWHVGCAHQGSILSILGIGDSDVGAIQALATAVGSAESGEQSSE